MEQDASNPPSARAPRKRRWRVAFVIVLLGATVVGWWLFTRPKEMRLTEIVSVDLPALPKNQYYKFIMASGYYFAYETEDITFGMRWRPGDEWSYVLHHAVSKYRYDGTLAWRVEMPTPRLPKGPSPDQFDRNGSVVLSRADVLVAAIADGNTQQIIRWKNGKRVGMVRLPLQKRMARLMPIRSGDLYCWIPDEPRGTLYLLKDNQVAAGGKVKTPLNMSSWEWNNAISDDGSAFVTATDKGFTYYQLSLSGRKLNIAPVYYAHEPTSLYFGSYNMPWVLQRDRLLTSTGAIYNDRGKVSPADGWKVAPSNSPSDKALVQSKFEGSESVRRVRVFNPSTRKAWSPGRRSYRFCYITGNGRFAITCRNSLVKYWIITKVTKVKYLPNFARTHIKRLIDQRAIDIMLYKRPGRARAYLRMQEDERTGDFIYTACNGCRYSMNINASLSEDAHILRFLSNDHERNWHILSFTW